MKGLWIPTIEIESSAGSREITLYSRHLSNRTIFIQGEINEDVANAVLVQLMYLQNEGTEDINLYINSPGNRHARNNAGSDPGNRTNRGICNCSCENRATIWN